MESDEIYQSFHFKKNDFKNVFLKTINDVLSPKTMVRYYMRNLYSLLVVAVILIMQIKASSSESLTMQIAQTTSERVCAHCSFGPAKDLSPHDISDEFPLTQVEHAIYPPAMKQSGANNFLLSQIGNIDFQHLKCMVMKIRCAMFKTRHNLYCRTIVSRIVHHEMDWAARVLLILWNGKALGAELVVKNDLSNSEKNEVCYFLKYLATVLPEVFMHLRPPLLKVISQLKMNRENDSTKELLWMVTLAEARAKWCQLNQTSPITLKKLFSMPDAYFLYLIIEMNKFMKIYSKKSVMKFIFSKFNQSYHDELEAFDVCRTVFIGLLVTRIKASQAPILEEFLNFGKRFQQTLSEEKRTFRNLKCLLNTAVWFKYQFGAEHKDSFLRNFAFKTEKLKYNIEIMMRILKKQLASSKGLSRVARKWVNARCFESKMFKNTLFWTQSFQEYYYDPSLINYKNILTNIVDIGIDFSGSVKFFSDPVSSLINNAIMDKKHSTNSVICKKCKLATLVNFFVLNFMNSKQRIMIEPNIGFLKRNGCVHDFRMAWTLSIAYNASYFF